jgi:hypothetical protein
LEVDNLFVRSLCYWRCLRSCLCSCCMHVLSVRELPCGGVLKSNVDECPCLVELVVVSQDRMCCRSNRHFVLRWDLMIHMKNTHIHLSTTISTSSVSHHLSLSLLPLIHTHHTTHTATQCPTRTHSLFSSSRSQLSIAHNHKSNNHRASTHHDYHHHHHPYASTKFQRSVPHTTA